MVCPPPGLGLDNRPRVDALRLAVDAKVRAVCQKVQWERRAGNGTRGDRRRKAAARETRLRAGGEVAVAAATSNRWLGCLQEKICMIS